MGKKRYVKPEIREESYVLTVRAAITTTTIAVQEQSATTDVVARLASTETEGAQAAATRLAEALQR